MNLKYPLLGAGTLAVIAGAYLFTGQDGPNEASSKPSEGDALVSVDVPQLDGNAAIGQTIFAASCAACHGDNAAGKDGAGPPLIHKIYEPGHHADESFQRAVAFGVRSHHWRFGDMAPVKGLTRGDVAMVIEYVRTIQRANGIF